MNDQLSLDDAHVYVSKTAQPTSVEAAQKALGGSGSQRRRVFDVIRVCKERGATDNEIAEALDLDGNSVRPRRKELEEMGMIRNSGKTRNTRSGSNAIIWVLDGI